jgi:hypothetical protein
MALEVFYSYAREDERLRDELEKHLSVLKRAGVIVSWHDRQIDPGGEWRKQIDQHIRTAQIILLLVSADFLASDYINEVEVKIALKRHASGEAIVIPIILRPVNWLRSPFSHLQAPPRDAKAATSWASLDDAFLNISQGIEEIANRFAAGPHAESSSSGRKEMGRLVDRQVARQRVLDAAMPSHVVKAVPTELLALIRLPGSVGLKGALLNDSEAEAKPEDVRAKDRA